MVPKNHTGPTAEISSYIVRTRYEDIPPEIVAFAKLCILDSVGCSIGGSHIRPGRIAAELWAELGGKSESTIFFTGQTVPCLHASYINSHLANVLDYDDTDIGHPGACIVPPAIAVAERIGATGKELITAVILGYEVYRRIAWAIRPSPERYRRVRAFNAQSFGAVTAAASLLGLDEHTATIAFGLAGANSRVPAGLKSGHGERPMSWVKNNCGWASMGGVLAALMAEKGYIASRTILDGDTGFWIMAGSDQCDFAAVTEALGEKSQILQTSFKPYPCCRYMHTTLDALCMIRGRYGVDLNRVDKIHVASFSRLRDFLDCQPASVVDAQFSLPYTLGMVALGIPPGYQWLTEENLRNPAALRIGSKVIYELDQEAERIFFEKEQYRSTVTVKVGSLQYVERSEQPLGSPSNPLTETQLHNKFLDLAEPIIGSQRAKRLLDGICSLEQLHSISILFR
ncbi:MAG: MmgE/PrpD family protein [Candidatus Eisenbacteria bacterium]|nr:MmgE/PrpD family protein [Candidatus Eisenbacteria bacterium]